MARSYLPLLALLAILGVAAGFLKAAVPHQETALPKGAKSPSALPAAFDAGLDNPDVVSDKNIHPARKCGFCMGVRVASRALAPRSVQLPRRVLNLVLSVVVSQ